MKLRVLIHRNRDYEACPGRLRAHVLQSRVNAKGESADVAGKDLLQRSVFKVVDSAVEEVDRIIMREYKLIDPPEIQYEIDEPEEVPAPQNDSKGPEVEAGGLIED